MGVTQALAEKIVSTTFDDLSPDAVAITRNVVLDGCANFLAGSVEPLSDLTASYVRSLGGPRQATVAGRDFKTHPVHAAYANGVFCHALDFELMWYPPTHPTSTTLPALFALAEDRTLGGSDIMCALAVGFEVQGRLRLAIEQAGVDVSESLHPPGQVGALGAAAGCANLIDLPVEKTRMALGIAGSRVSGLMANTGTMTKATHCGHAARMGLESVLLAEQGFTANPRILEETHGYNDTLFQGRLPVDAVTVDFGDPYRMVEPGLTFKKYPAQYPTHWSIDAALAVRETHDLDPVDINTVRVEVGANNEAADRTNPDTGLDGKFSLTYTVAAALLDGEVTINTFRDDRRFAPDIEDMMERVTIEKNPDIDAMDFATAWSRVTVELRTGESYSARIDRPSGIWDNPVSWDRYVKKFHHCARQVITDRAAGELVDLIESFETHRTIELVMDLVRGSSASG